MSQPAVRRLTVVLLGLVAALPAIALASPSASQASTQPAPSARFGEWAAWIPVGLTPSYFNVLPRQEGKLELWFDARTGQHDAVIGLVGATLGDMEKTLPRFDARTVEGYKEHKPRRATPIISRASALRLADGSHAVLASVGPEYEGGATELYPALFVSQDGKTGTWKHTGPPAGEPAAWLADARKTKTKIRCEGAGLIQLADGSLRMYCRGYGVRLALAEAKTIEGPWTFKRNAQGGILDVEAGLPGGEWVFSHVAPVGEHGYLLTGANTWPPTEIWAALSSDGIRFTVMGRGQGPGPVLKAGEVVAGAKLIKCLRGAYDPKTGMFEAAANTWDEDRKAWVLMHNRAKLVVEKRE